MSCDGWRVADATTPPELRFNVTEHTSGDSYSIYDHWVGERVLLSKSTFKKPQFDISRWYAKHRSRAWGLTSLVEHRCAMGQAISIVATKLLIDSISSHYPSVRARSDPRPHFLVTQTTYSKRTNEFVIIDRDSHGHFYLDRELLETPSFDLVGWYAQHVLEDRAYRQQRGNELSLNTNQCEETHKFMSCAKLLSNMALNSLQIDEGGNTNPTDSLRRK